MFICLLENVNVVHGGNRTLGTRRAYYLRVRPRGMIGRGEGKRERKLWEGGGVVYCLFSLYLHIVFLRSPWFHFTWGEIFVSEDGHFVTSFLETARLNRPPGNRTEKKLVIVLAKVVQAAGDGELPSQKKQLTATDRLFNLLLFRPTSRF